MSEPDSNAPTLPDPGSPRPPPDETLPPGTMVADRYRIVARLGAGGMGTVYRAEDLRLSQDVALKFLSQRAGELGVDALATFVNEVSLARQVTHRNVCRVHDIGEVDGRTFLSMEFVAGEDLASLVRRIGRLPAAKALDLARQITAGLHAAHDRGVLHRDLKPQNVLIDERGDAKLSDFGIAGVVRAASSAAPVAGTPGYMAPELFTGGEPSVQSDLYSLGVVLYELFCGERLHAAGSMTELLEKHRRPVPPPSSVVPNIDRDVERIIVRCLDRDPDRRPPSALAVLGALPGADPLGDALAAGRLPSVELLLQTGERCQLGGRHAIALAFALVVALALLFGFETDYKLIGRTPLPNSGDVLAHVAREHLADLGHPRDRSHEAYGFDFDRGLVDAIARDSKSNHRWEQLRSGRPPAVGFWYRRSPVALMAAHLSGRVGWSDPGFDRPGMVRVRLDALGDLRRLEVVGGSFWPERELESADPVAAVFHATGLDPSRFEPAAPRTPTSFADTRSAWTGTRVDAPDERVRLDLAMLRGRVVWVRVAEERWLEAVDPGTAFVADPIGDGVKLVALLGAVWLAVRSLRRGLGDRRGALRFASILFGLVTGVTLLTAKHPGVLGAEVRLVLQALARGLLVAAQYWVLYIALEPHVRRAWPETIQAWTRLLAGRFRDPMVGRSVLFGLLLGAFSVLGLALESVGRSTFGAGGGAPLWVEGRSLEVLDGAASTVGACLEILALNTGYCMAVLLVLIMLRVSVRSRWGAAAGTAVVVAAVWSVRESSDPSGWLVRGAIAVAAVVVLARVGLLALIFAVFAAQLLMAAPLVLDLTSWRAGPTVFAVGVFAVLTAYGLMTTSMEPRLVDD